MTHKDDRVEDGAGTQAALDFFVGTVYAVMIALLVATAHEAGLFNNPLFTAAFFVLLFFFAQDWMSRELGNRRIRYFRSSVAAGPYFTKMLLDVLIAYLLLLATLRLTQLSVNPVEADAAMMTAAFQVLEDQTLRVRLGIFGVAAGVWNLIVIRSSDLLLREEKRILWRGQVPSSLLARYFLKIKSWQDDLESEFRVLDEQQEVANRRVDTEKTRVLDGTLVYNVKAIFRVLWKGLSNPIKILVPYALTAHLLLLNCVLGVLLLLSKYVSIPATLLDFWFLIPVSILAALLGHSFHLSPRPDTRPWLERLSSGLLLVAILGAYVLAWAFSPASLVLIVVFQQLAANYFMVLYFQPVPTALASEEATT